MNELRNELVAVHRIDVTVLPFDLSDPASPAAIERELRDRGIDIDVLVNNAGFGAAGRFAEVDLERQIRMIAVNISSLTELTRRLLPPMIERGRGGILNVGSTAAFQAGPMMAVYYATKAYVQSFSEALFEELKGTGVTLTCLAPGPTATGFQREAGIERFRLLKLGTMDAAAVARVGYSGFRDGAVTVIPGLMNKLGVTSVKFLPRAVTRRIVRYLQS